MITFNYNQWCHRLHSGNTQYKQFPQKKKKIEGKGERENEKQKQKKKKEKEKNRAEEGSKKGRKRKTKSRGRRQKEKRRRRKREKRKEEKKERERKEVEKRRRRKGMEGVCAEGKGRGRMRGGKKERKEGEGEGRREREREKENGESGAKGALPSPNAFPNTKLGNNMTPIKGRLGKNTTSTSRSSTKPNQNLQDNPQQRRPDFDASSRTNFSYAPKGSKYKFYSKGATIYKKAKALRKSRSRSTFSINPY